MGYLLWFAAGVVGLLGAVLLAVGLILFLCEGSWGKPAGSMGSRGMLAAGGVLCLPVAVWLLLALLYEVGLVR